MWKSRARRQSQGTPDKPIFYIQKSQQREQYLKSRQDNAALVSKFVSLLNDRDTLDKLTGTTLDLFANADTNHDGTLDLAEFTQLVVGFKPTSGLTQAEIKTFKQLTL